MQQENKTDLHGTRNRTMTGAEYGINRTCKKRGVSYSCIHTHRIASHQNAFSASSQLKSPRVVLVFWSCRHLSNAFSPSTSSSAHLSLTIPQVLERTMPSTINSLRTNDAKASVLTSLGKYLPLYGSNLSLTTLSLALVSSTSLKI